LRAALTDVEIGDSFSVILVLLAARQDGRVTILHGVEDDLIPLSQAAQLADALEVASALGEMHRLSATGHNGIIASLECRSIIQIWAEGLPRA
jgi:predicted esterase